MIRITMPAALSTRVDIAFYSLIILLITLRMLSYGKSFRKQNRASLYATILLVFIGIGMQELLGHDYRIAYLAVTFGAVFLFIHYSEFAQLKLDEEITEQQIKISSDALTGVYSRFAYVEALDACNASVPDNLTVFLFDINGLKATNDSAGHEAGDELIRGAAACIESAVGKYGKTFRIGGDEFVALVPMTGMQAEDALRELTQETEGWAGKTVRNLSLSVGYVLARDYPGLSVEKLVREADRAMYVQKKEYYHRRSRDRRHTPSGT